MPAWTDIGAIRIEDAPVVARDDDQRVLAQLQPIERFEHAADGRVEFLNDIASHSGLAGAAKPGMRHARNVRVVSREVEEERSRLGAAR